MRLEKKRADLERLPHSNLVRGVELMACIPAAWSKHLEDFASEVRSAAEQGRAHDLSLHNPAIAASQRTAINELGQCYMWPGHEEYQADRAPIHLWNALGTLAQPQHYNLSVRLDGETQRVLLATEE